MQSPWVSRELYEQLRADLDYERYRAKMDHERYETLLERYQALKLQGAAIPDPPKTLERPEFDPVMAAITAKAGPDQKLRNLMIREATLARRMDVDDMEIIRQIEYGVSIDEEGIMT